MCTKVSGVDFFVTYMYIAISVQGHVVMILISIYSPEDSKPHCRTECGFNSAAACSEVILQQFLYAYAYPTMLWLQALLVTGIFLV